MTEEIETQLKVAASQIRRQKWFKGDWTLQHTQSDPDGTPWVGMQLSKSNWFNDDGMGIHFETWVGEKDLKKSKLPFVLHILHKPFFPGTDVKAVEFMRRWHAIPEPAELVSSWPGYKVGRAKPFKGERKFDPEDISATIAKEFTRLHILGSYVDQVLQELIPGQ